MKGEDYLSSIQGLLHQFYSRFKEHIVFEIKQEPKTKGSMKENEIREFRQALADHLKKNKRKRFTSKIFLEIRFSYYPKNNVPSIQNLVKNYLDLMHKPMEKVDNMEKILFNDDSQICVLSAYLEIAENKNSNGVFIRAYRHSSFVKDVFISETAYHRLEQSSADTDEDFDNNKNRDFFGELDDLHNDNIEEEDRVMQDFNKTRRQMILRELQEQLLKQGNLSLTSFFMLYRSHYMATPDIGKSLGLLNFDYKKIALLSTNSIELGGSTIEKGKKPIFKNQLSQKILRFRNRYKILFPLLHPITILVIYTPPRFLPLDPDNLVKHIFPLVTELLDPPYSHEQGWKRISLPFKDDSTIRIPGRIPKSGMTGYQLIQLPRDEASTDEGKIDLIVADGSHPVLNNIWWQMNRLMDKLGELEG